MDKDRKLKRYRRKDYSEMVEFPVEIVGRDGKVRHYDFEESVRLYQRRMSFASVRYRDDDLVRAELGHCRARIEQLRRSFFHLHGWTDGEGPETDDPELAGELAGFLVRVFRDPGRVDVRFTALEADAAESWYLTRDGASGGLLLYVYRLDGDVAALREQAFHQHVAQLERATAGRVGDAERLIASHHVADVAFVLTGRADDVARLAAAVPSGDTDAVERTPWDDVVDFVRRGDLPAAYLRCRSIVDDQPWHRDAYVLGAALAVQLRRVGDAEDLAFVGSRYFPEDALLFHALGMARLHDGRLDQADEALARALTLDPTLTVSRSLRLWVLGARRHVGQALRVMRLPKTAAEGADEANHRHLVALGARVTLFAAGVSLCLLLTSLLTLLAGIQGAVAMVAVAALGALGGTVFRQRIDAARERHLFEEPQAVLARIRRTRDETRG